MSQLCTKLKAEESRYMPKRISRMRPMKTKSMEPVPRSLATQPVARAVVAWASTLGPAMLKMVESTANTTTTPREILYRPRAFSSWRSVPWKSLARSVVIRPGLGISIILLR